MASLALGIREVRLMRPMHLLLGLSMLNLAFLLFELAFNVLAVPFF
jgi:hypothetical protein